MRLKSIRGASAAMAALGMMFVPTAAEAQPASSPGVGFAIVGVATGQSARVNALNLGSMSSTADSSCSVTLQFLDTQGQQLKQSVVTLGSGKGASLDLSRDQAPGDDARVQIRVVLLFGYSGGAAPGPDVLQQFDCNIVPSLEVYDNNTGRTSFILTDAKPLPASGKLTQVAGAPPKTRK